MKTIQARLPEKLYQEVEEVVEIGMYATSSEVIRDALRKTFADHSREFLRGLAKKHNIKKEDLIKEWEKLRHERN